MPRSITLRINFSREDKIAGEAIHKAIIKAIIVLAFIGTGKKSLVYTDVTSICEASLIFDASLSLYSHRSLFFKGTNYTLT